MKSFSITARKLALLLTAIIAGISLYAAATSLLLENTLFDPKTHKNLMEKYNLYARAGSILESSLKEYIELLNTGSAKNPAQNEQYLLLAKRAVTPEMIKLNADSIVEGLLKYFRNETRFLPDIYIKPVSDSGLQGLQGKNPEEGRVTEASISNIDKVNLSLIIMYLDKPAIMDKLSFVRLFQYTLSRTTQLTAFLFLFCILSIFFIAKSKTEFAFWIKKSVLTAALAFTAAGLLSFCYLYCILPLSAGLISFVSVFGKASVICYMQNWLSPFLLFNLAAGISTSLIAAHKKAAHF